MKRDFCDFSRIPARHDAINVRLEHWARWVAVRPQPWKTQPMFRQYRSHAWQWHMPEIKFELNTIECHEVERAVAFLPDKHRSAVRWFYVYRHDPGAMARHLAVSTAALLKLVEDARDMLKNRLCERIKPDTMRES